MAALFAILESLSTLILFVPSLPIFPVLQDKFLEELNGISEISEVLRVESATKWFLTFAKHFPFYLFACIDWLIRGNMAFFSVAPCLGGLLLSEGLTFTQSILLMAICHQLRRIKEGSFKRQSAAYICSIYINTSSFFSEITA